VHARQRHESNSGVVHLAREQLCQLGAKLIGNTIGTGTLAHGKSKVKS
jgi:hypothetical protein